MKIHGKRANYQLSWGDNGCLSTGKARESAKGGYEMTQNQINWARLQEDIRHNQAGEGETNRHNLAGEIETNRTNLVNESLKKEANAINWGVLGESKRHNQAVESETNRHDVAMEQQDAKELFQRQYEYATTGKDLDKAEIDRRNAQAELFNREALSELLKMDQIDLQKQYLEQQIEQARAQGILNQALTDKAIAQIHQAGHSQLMDWLNLLLGSGRDAMSVVKLFTK